MTEDGTVIRRFINEMDAELTRAKLEASGIRAFVAADNCGGMRPHLQVATGIRLMVAEEDVEQALDILSKSEELALPDDFVPPKVPPEEKPRPINKRVLLTWCIIGATAVLLVILSPKIPYLISSIVNAPNYELVLTPVINDEATAAKIQEVISARLKAAELTHKLESISEGRLKLEVTLSDKISADFVRSLVQQTGVLQFRLVHRKNDELIKELFEKKPAPEGYRIVSVGYQQWYQRDPDVPDTDTAYRNKIAGFNIPGPAYEFMLAKDEREGNTVYRPYFVNRRAEMTGEYIKDASVVLRGLGQPVVAISFDSKGARMFATITADYAPGGARNTDVDTGRQLAIVLDGALYAAPVIREAMHGGKAEISGAFTLEEAESLATILRAGFLPCPVKIVEEHRLSNNR